MCAAEELRTSEQLQQVVHGGFSPYGWFIIEHGVKNKNLLFDVLFLKCGKF